MRRARGAISSALPTASYRGLGDLLAVNLRGARRRSRLLTV